MLIFGIITSLLTFPGVIVHELSHQLFCWYFKVPVFKVVYFQLGNPAGYVQHGAVKNKAQDILISVGPFFVNTVMGALISLPAALPVFTLHTASPLDYLLIYLGVSIAIHAFPSRGDANAVWHSIREEGTPIWAKIVGYPVVGLIYLGSLGSFFWLDVLYGIGVAVALPNLIIYLLA
jgi:hypothetical protein